MKGNRNALDALQRAIRHTRKRFSAGTPERYPGTPLYGLRLSEAEPWYVWKERYDGLAAELERVTAALRDEKRLRLEFGTLLTSEQIDAAYARAGGARAAQQGER
jgi:hypothetical protein